MAPMPWRRSRPTIRKRWLPRSASRRFAPRRRGSPTSCRSGANAAYCARRYANCSAWRPRPSPCWRCRRGRRSARFCSMWRAARCALPASRPARPGRSATIPSSRCCALPRMLACSAACARPPVPKKSSRSSRRSILAPPRRLPACSNRSLPSPASAAASRLGSRARSSASRPNLPASTGCIRMPPSGSTCSKCVMTAVSP